MATENGKMLHYIGKAIERPLMIMPEKLALIASVLEGRLGLDASGLQQLVDQSLLAHVSKPSASRFEGENEFADGSKPMGRVKLKPYKVANGVAVISVVGSLVNRGAWVGSYSGMTSYEGIQHQLKTAARDESISSILLDIDTPGGEAVGAFETGAAVRAADAVKPVHAFVNGLCCSAGMALAAGARRIEATSTSLLGSIGVVMMHVDQSKRLHDMGVKPTFIFAGSHKVDGNSFEPLSASVKSDMQAEVDKFYDLFVAHVAAGRKGLSNKAIREQEARTFIGSDAVERKLADGIGTFETTLTGMQRRSNTRKTKMNMEDDTPTFTATQHQQLLAAAVANARADTTQSVTANLTAEHTKALSESTATARAEGAKAERERINSILGLEEAQGRQASALHMAMNTDMTAEQVKPVLAGLPIGAQPAAAAAASATAQKSGFGLVVEKAPAKVDAAATWDKSMAKAGAKYA